MNNHEAIDQLKLFIIKHDLPETDFALFNVKCPYCGKSDRIRQLEPPDTLNSRFKTEELSVYTDIWQQFVQLDESLGVCKFCNTPLKLLNDGGVETLSQADSD